jgi:hypothetical protein
VASARCRSRLARAWPPSAPSLPAALARPYVARVSRTTLGIAAPDASSPSAPKGVSGIMFANPSMSLVAGAGFEPATFGLRVAAGDQRPRQLAVGGVPTQAERGMSRNPAAAVCVVHWAGSARGVAKGQGVQGPKRGGAQAPPRRRRAAFSGYLVRVTGVEVPTLPVASYPFAVSVWVPGTQGLVFSLNVHGWAPSVA